MRRDPEVVSGRPGVIRKRWVPAAAAVLVAGVCGVVAGFGAGHPAKAAGAPSASTEKVERGPLSALVSGAGTLTYRARSDGSPFVVVNQAGGVYTQLPEAGDRVGCGGVLYRVDNRPVVLLYGPVPAYRGLHFGMQGPDVRQLNRNLHHLGHHADAHDNAFTSKTEQALRALQRAKGVTVTGELATHDVVFLPEAVRIAKVIGQVGGSARPGAPVLSATSDKLHVRVDLDASQQSAVKKGDRAQITLPGNVLVTGRVARFGRVAVAGQGSQPAAATIPTFISLEHPAKARGLDQAPVQVDITTKGVDDALSVPVTALVGRSGGGYAVEVVRGSGRREPVAVQLGLFDTAGGRVQVEGDLRAGDSVVVPSL
jgi:peptidoglycan hydrolase-like protein with peptidoglycan-binding domain